MKLSPNSNSNVKSILLQRNGGFGGNHGNGGFGGFEQGGHQQGGHHHG